MRPSIVIGPRTTKSPEGTTSGLYGLLRAVAGLQFITARATATIRVPASVEADVNFIPVDDLVSDMVALRDAEFGEHEVYHLTANAGVTVAQCMETTVAITGLSNVVLLAPGSFEPNALERRIAGRVEFYLGYLSIAKTFARRLPSRLDIDRDELTTYVAVAYRALVRGSPADAPVAATADYRRTGSVTQK